LHEPLKAAEDPIKAHFDSILTQCAHYALKQGSSKRPITCFISYAWNQPEHELWVEKLAEDLEKAGFRVLLDRWLTRKGHETMDFVEKIMSKDTDYVLVIGTKLYLDKYQYHAEGLDDREYVLRVEARLLNHLIGYNQHKSNKVIPILLEGTPHESLPPLMRAKNIVDFTQGSYCSTLLELIRDMYNMDQKDPLFKKWIEEYKK
jgi:hypothetical protein